MRYDSNYCYDYLIDAADCIRTNPSQAMAYLLLAMAASNVLVADRARRPHIMRALNYCRAAQRRAMA